MSESRCHRLPVPASCCYLSFVPRKRASRTEHLGYTATGDMFIVDYDERGGIIGVELVGDGKPCQQADHDFGPMTPFTES